MLERLLQKLGTICVCQSRTVEAGAFNSKCVPVEWCGVPPPSINYHDVKKSSWWYDVPHCTLALWCIIFQLPWRKNEHWGVYICMCATVATLAISGCVLRNNRYHFWGPFIWMETISSPFLLYFVTRIPGLCKCWLVLYTKEVVQKQRTLISVDAQRLPTRAQCGGIARG